MAHDVGRGGAGKCLADRRFILAESEIVDLFFWRMMVFYTYMDIIKGSG